MYFIIKNKPFLFYFLISIFQLKQSINYIILPFKTTNISTSATSQTFTNNPIQNIFSQLNANKIFTQISFGSPPKSIDFYFSMNDYISSIDSNSCVKGSTSSYIPSKSTTYKIIQNFENSKYILSTEKCSMYKDLDLAENITYNSFQFYLREKSQNNLNEEEKDKYCGTIGLRHYSQVNAALDKDSFVYNLKKNNIINSYAWGIFFFNQEKLYNIDDDTQGEYDGFFIAGVTMDDNIDIFDTEFVCSVYAEEDSIYWSFYFDRIFYYEKINNTVEYISTNNTRVEMVLDLNYIISDEQYYKDVKNVYFKKYFENNTCYERKELIENEGGFTYMIICDIIFNNYKKSFPNVYFYSEQLFLAFNLNSDDIFYEYNNKIYFLIVYKDTVKNFWKLGKIFLKKYPFMFDYDKKIISYIHLKRVWNPKKHSKKETNKNNTTNIAKNNKIKNVKEYILIILLVIGIIIGLVIGKRIWNKNNRLKANELEENYKFMDKNIDNVDKDKVGIIN